MTSGRTHGDPHPSQLDPESYTALRLQHASPKHLHLTTRRCFVGPIPEGWLKSHRKSWYKKYIGFSAYSSRAVTFSAGSNVSHQRQITGIDGPSASATFSRSFPQPDDIEDEEETPKHPGGDSNADGDDTDEQNAGNRKLQELETQAIIDKKTLVENLDEEPEDPRPKRRSTFAERLSPKGLKEKARSSSFVTASSTPHKTSPLKSRLSPISTSRTPRPTSFVTASESPPKAGPSAGIQANLDPETPQSGTQNGSNNGDILNGGNDSNSLAALLPGTPNEPSPNASQSRTQDDQTKEPTEAHTKSQATAKGMVRFNVDEQTGQGEAETAAKLAQTAGDRRMWRRLRAGSHHPGEIVKMEKMLVRVDTTLQELPPDYNENDSLKTSARTVDKWREFIVVCRESTTDEVAFSIQMYKSRVIRSTEATHVKKRSTHEIPLTRKSTHVNLYSSLDKTLVLWMPWKQGTAIYILRTHSVASAVEWHTFIRHCLGLQRKTNLQINVPDLSVSLQLQNPFRELETSMSSASGIRSEEAAVTKTMETERAVAHSIIDQSLKMLENNPEWADVLEKWLANEKIGLAWKRYDRLEWVHGANEQRMYGTLAMQRTHELELRPKDHYPTSISPKNELPTDEPPPVEGFLIRLTSQKGNIRKLGKMYFKRLYFTTHNQYLCYTRPSQALPPPPPQLHLSDNSKIPRASDIVNNAPLIYAVNPFPSKDGNIEWLDEGTSSSRSVRDENAYKEAERSVNSMLSADGYINLSHVNRVQNIKRGSTSVDDDLDQGSEVDFHEEVRDTTRDDGKVRQFDDDRTFELVMKNKIVIRLQAFNEATKDEWINRLRKLVHYWKLRLAEDVDLLKEVRAANLKRLEIDEESEAYLGQFGSKWEVTRSVTSSKLFNMCGISCCRAITKSGVLYRKPKRHSTFQRCGVILCHGHLLIFHGTLRKYSGAEIPHIQHDRQADINLKSCYIYSGLITQDDLLYQNQRHFDVNRPGNYAIPRVYLEDGWTSVDEDSMTTFVIWQPQTKSLFKSSEEKEGGGKRNALRRVSRLGVLGRSIVFKTRSRAERDHWVMSIGMEIDRLQTGQDIRIVNKG